MKTSIAIRTAWQRKGDGMTEKEFLESEKKRLETEIEVGEQRLEFNRNSLKCVECLLASREQGKMLG